MKLASLLASIFAVATTSAFSPTSNSHVVQSSARRCAAVSSSQLSAMPICIVVEAEIKEDRMDEFLDMIEKNAVGSRAEPGCIRFGMCGCNLYGCICVFHAPSWRFFYWITYLVLKIEKCRNEKKMHGKIYLVIRATMLHGFTLSNAWYFLTWIFVHPFSLPTQSLRWTPRNFHNIFNTKIHIQTSSKQKTKLTNSSFTKSTKMPLPLLIIRNNLIMPRGGHLRRVGGLFQVFPRRLLESSWRKLMTESVFCAWKRGRWWESGVSESMNNLMNYSATYTNNSTLVYESITFMLQNLTLL